MMYLEVLLVKFQDLEQYWDCPLTHKIGMCEAIAPFSILLGLASTLA